MMKVAGVPYQEAVRRFQAAYVDQVLAKHQGHLGKTAVELGMHRNTITRTLMHFRGSVALSEKKLVGGAMSRLLKERWAL
jgi:DNA-binding NtrC family response regulator